MKTAGSAAMATLKPKAAIDPKEKLNKPAQVGDPF
ncbi:hypothetical protein CYA_2733 [Synechococcus sp. JA-3-3Ab]|nr:hypothetical protein CYA_2733 [Synechococcus sp. JA-3-3Ab]